MSDLTLADPLVPLSTPYGLIKARSLSPAISPHTHTLLDITVASLVKITAKCIIPSKTPVVTPLITPLEPQEAGLDVVLEIFALVRHHSTVLIRYLHLECGLHRLAHCHLDSPADVSGRGLLLGSFN